MLNLFYFGVPALLVARWLLSLFGEWFSGINGITKDLWGDAEIIVTECLPNYLFVIILPYCLAYTALALYCIACRPSTARVAELRLKIHKTIWGPNA